MNMYFSFRSNSSHKVCLAVITGVVAGVLVLPGVCSRCISRCSGTSRCVTGVSAGVLVLPGVCSRCISRCSGTSRCMLQVYQPVFWYFQVCVTGVLAGVLVLPGVLQVYQQVFGGSISAPNSAPITPSNTMAVACFRRSS